LTLATHLSQVDVMYCSGTKVLLRKISGKKANVAAWAAAAFLVLSAAHAAYPAKAMPHTKAYATTSTRPGIPVADLSPRMMASRMIRTTWAASTAAAATIGPQTIDSRRAGVSSSLVK
jgi:hypothetical protein